MGLVLCFSYFHYTIFSRILARLLQCLSGIVGWVGGRAATRAAPTEAITPLSGRQDFRICRIGRWEDCMVGSHKNQGNTQKYAETPKQNTLQRSENNPLLEGRSTKNQNLLGEAWVYRKNWTDIKKLLCFILFFAILYFGIHKIRLSMD